MYGTQNKEFVTDVSYHNVDEIKQILQIGTSSPRIQFTKTFTFPQNYKIRVFAHRTIFYIIHLFDRSIAILSLECIDVLYIKNYPIQKIIISISCSFIHKMLI